MCRIILILHIFLFYNLIQYSMQNFEYDKLYYSAASFAAVLLTIDLISVAGDGL